MLIRRSVLWWASGVMHLILFLTSMAATRVSSFVVASSKSAFVNTPGSGTALKIHRTGYSGKGNAYRVCSPVRRQAPMMQIDPNLVFDPAAIHLATSLSPDDAARYFLAGGICCSISHSWTVPIDVVKTRIQTDAPLRGLSPIEAAKAIIKKDGLGGLFLGFGSTFVGYTSAGSMKYGLYEVFKPLAFDAVMGQKLLSFLLAGCAAEIIASSWLMPFESTRIRLVTEPGFANEIFDALPKLIKEKGLGTIYAGLPTIWTKMLPGTMFQLASYELFASQAYLLIEVSGISVDSTARFVISTTCALLASVVSTLASHPGDCLLSEMNKAGAQDESPLTVLRGMGFAELTAGLGTRLVHVVALVTTQLVIYDYAKALVGLSFTGAK